MAVVWFVRDWVLVGVSTRSADYADYTDVQRGENIVLGPLFRVMKKMAKINNPLENKTEGYDGNGAGPTFSVGCAADTTGRRFASNAVSRGIVRW